MREMSLTLQVEKCNINWLSNFPKVIELVKVKDGTQIQAAFLLQNSHS